MTITSVDMAEPEQPSAPACWCCGKGSDSARGLVRLEGHSDVSICFNCLDWLVEDRRKQLEDVKRWTRQPRWERIRGVFPGKRC